MVGTGGVDGTCRGGGVTSRDHHNPWRQYPVTVLFAALGDLFLLVSFVVIRALS